MKKYLGKRPKRIKEWARLGYNGKSDDPDYDHYKPRKDHKNDHGHHHHYNNNHNEKSGNDDDENNHGSYHEDDSHNNGTANWGGYEYKPMGPKTNWAKYDPY